MMVSSMDIAEDQCGLKNSCLTAMLLRGLNSATIAAEIPLSRTDKGLLRFVIVHLEI
jgi:hypothetical protein